jgi:hypothetical protein
MLCMILSLEVVSESERSSTAYFIRALQLAREYPPILSMYTQALTDELR